MTGTRLHTCMPCEATCGIVAQIEGGRVTGIRGDGDDPSSRGAGADRHAAVRPGRLSKFTEGLGRFREIAVSPPADVVALNARQGTVGSFGRFRAGAREPEVAS